MTRTATPAIASLGLVLQLTTTAFAAEHRLPGPDENIRQTLEHSGVLSPSAQPSALDEARARRRPLQGKVLESFTVGSTADGACDFNDIQSAIDAAAANGPALDFIRIAGNQDATRRVAVAAHL